MRPSLLVLFVLTAPAAAQVPATDIFVATLKVTLGPNGAAQWQLGPPVNVTHRPGYDNQPCFLPGGHAFLYTVIGDDAQADIYRYDFAAGKSTRLTATPESEYSPTPLPDGRGFSVVRVEADSTQRLWAFDLDGSHPRLLLPGVKPVGYHAWIDSVTVALFVLGTPATLQLADLRTGKADTVVRDVGRSPQRVPGRAAVSVVWRRDSTARWIAIVDATTRTPQPFAPLPDSADFHAWTPDGTLLASAGTRVLRWDPQAARWVPIADFAAAGLTSITRLAVSPSGAHLALVAIPAAR
ncbi:MAG TPA: hypothetical protein VEO93_04280 [Gemmatimonadales bacterium]|nr:hypothetical protein [Gemmatimonadales bacterium]